MTFNYNGKSAKDIELQGTEPSYFDIKNIEIASGRAFTPEEVRAGLPVLVIGDLVAESFFPGTNPLGKAITIAGLPYRVIGVAAKRGTLFGISLDKFAVMPFSAPARRHICPIGILDELEIKAANPQQMLIAMDEVETVMRNRRHLHPREENNFDLQNAAGALEGWKNISKYLITALPLLVGISLVVGGIVIMNIMLMAVAERTREIGIRKALGAKRRDILAQFVVESATLATVGAALGVGAGLLLAFAVRALTPLPAAVAPWSIGVGVTIGMLVGVVAGVYPASRASRLDPIVALRAE
jgi:putative ABC transport system permease protein